jgi:hypothetical protein
MMQHRGMILFGLGFAVMVAFGWIVFPELVYRSTDQPFQFSHKVHAGESVGLSCTDCHAFREDGSFAGIPVLSRCAECHSEAIGESPDERILVEEYIKKERDVPWGVYARQPQNVYFPHVQHVKLAELECQRCHGPHGESDRLRPVQINRISGYSRDISGSSITGMKKGEWDGMTMDDCATCHRTHGAQNNCLTCHK